MADPKSTTALTVTKKKEIHKPFAKPENVLVRKARVAKWIVAMANGMSKKDLAKQENVDKNTILNEMKWAEREGFFEKAEEAILNRLVPLAIDVYEKALKKHLESGDYDAAERLLDKTMLFSAASRKRDREADASPAGDGEVEMTWEKFVARRTVPSPQVVAEPVEPESSAPIEAEVIEKGDEDATT